MKNIIVSVNTGKELAEHVIKRLIAWAGKNNVRLFSMTELEHDEIENIGKEQLRSFSVDDTVVIAFGGDGTMLSTARCIIDSGFRLLGINLGSLGFLSEIKQESMENALDNVRNGEYSIEKRILLEAEGMDTFIALNDIVMYSANRQRMLKIKIMVDGNTISELNADGVIVSTPTGSTAYSMSAGGPIVFSDVSCMLITPVCPHMLVQRPIVISDDSVIQLIPMSEGAIISADSQKNHDVESNMPVTIRKYGKELELIKLSDTRFIDVMREKFHLGKDPRQ